MKSNSRVALVTGASRGIGKGIAEYLIKKGYFVHCTYNKDRELIEKAFKKNTNAAIHHLDVGNESNVKEIYTQVDKISHGFQLLVNNAGVDYYNPITCAVALAKYGIRTHSVNPGVTRTPLWDPWGVTDKDWEKMARENPLGRNCTPEDVAKIIFYLDSEEAEYLNGEEIYTNGGNHLRNL